MGGDWDGKYTPSTGLGTQGHEVEEREQILQGSGYRDYRNQLSTCLSTHGNLWAPESFSLNDLPLIT
jgi:hypothetical protein